MLTKSYKLLVDNLNYGRQCASTFLLFLLTYEMIKYVLDVIYKIVIP